MGLVMRKSFKILVFLLFVLGVFCILISEPSAIDRAGHSIPKVTGHSRVYMINKNRKQLSFDNILRLPESSHGVTAIISIWRRPDSIQRSVDSLLSQTANVSEVQPLFFFFFVWLFFPRSLRLGMVGSFCKPNGGYNEDPHQ